MQGLVVVAAKLPLAHGVSVAHDATTAVIVATETLLPLPLAWEMPHSGPNEMRWKMRNWH